MTNENKDYAKLKEVSKCFTEETLENILCTKHNGKVAKVLSWSFNGSNTKGDNYLSTIYKIQITGIVDEQKVEVKMVIKAIPSNIGRRKTFRSTDFFRNETVFYTKVVPKFETFLKSKNQSKILCVPLHLASTMDGENDYIALEDVTVLGYKTMARQDYLDLEHCMVVLRTMAKFHAISFAYKDQFNDKFMEIVDSLYETYYSNEHWNWYKRFHEKIVDIAKNALALEYSGSEAEKKFSSYTASILYKKASELCSRKYDQTSVVTQGDCWTPNFMARNTEKDALMLDFQLARCASPITDLSTFLYACTDKVMWDEKFDTLLKFYHTELYNTIRMLGSNPENLYPWSTFMKEVKDQFVFGMIFAMEMIPMILLEESETFDLDLIKENKAIDIADVWTIANIQTQTGRLRMANLIVHAVEKGFL